MVLGVDVQSKLSRRSPSDGLYWKGVESVKSISKVELCRTAAVKVPLKTVSASPPSFARLQEPGEPGVNVVVLSVKVAAPERVDASVPPVRAELEKAIA